MAVNTHISQTAVDFQGLAELRRSSNKDGNDAETLLKNLASDISDSNEQKRFITDVSQYIKKRFN